MLRGLLTQIVMLIITPLFAIPVGLIPLIAPAWSDTSMRLCRIWGRTMLRVVGARVEFHGLPNATRDRPCVFIANHQSIVDIWAILCFMPLDTRFVAKKELFRIPIFGWALAASGSISIDRGNRTAAIRSLDRAAERIRSGRSVLLYPEGTRSRDGSLQPFKKGAFHLALAAGVPVVPVAITGAYRILPPRRLRVRPGRVDVWIDPPIDVGPYRPDGYQRLLDDVRSRIVRRFDQAAA